MKTFLYGQDMANWSLASDQSHVSAFLSELGIELTSNIFAADCVHSVWWNQLLSRKSQLLRLKKCVLTTAANFITPDNPDFIKVSRWAKNWVVPSTNQQKLFDNLNLNAYYQPFYVDENIFRPKSKTKAELCAELGLDKTLFENRFIIGSFQRDTKYFDMLSPKWQKGPELLIKLLAALPDKDKWLLLLAGPRRHYVVNECKKLGIPYYAYKTEPQPGIDDIHTNTTPASVMSRLYNLTDCYIISSVSEGGPKAALECAWSKTPVLSTKVGLAPDVLGDFSLFEQEKNAVARLTEMIANRTSEQIHISVETNYEKVSAVASHDAIKLRWKNIYADIKNTYSL